MLYTFNERLYVVYAFNSLFEMLDQVLKEYGLIEVKHLSILYLRCP